jgi:hypothetical protein
MDASSRHDSAPTSVPKTKSKDARKWRHFDLLMCDPTVPSGLKIVAYRLVWHHNSETGQCDPSYDLIAAFTGLPEKGGRPRVLNVE